MSSMSMSATPTMSSMSMSMGSSAMNHMSHMASTGSMSMASMASMTASSAMASSTGMDMGGHDMGSMDMGSSCQMKMFWNWYTIDACFISESWHITSKGMFAGSCIGVIFLVMAWELLRRTQREYDRFIIRQWNTKKAGTTAPCCGSNDSTEDVAPKSFQNKLPLVKFFSSTACAPVGTFRPTVFQQLIRALFHAVNLGVAYIVMLLVMYYNGYIFFCILIGALLGNFFFGSDCLGQTVAEESGCC